MKNKRGACAYRNQVSFGYRLHQDLHGPILKEFGSDLSQWDLSTQKLLELDADILCEGHFGIYGTKKEVTNYIRSLRIQYKVE